MLKCCNLIDWILERGQDFWEDVRETIDRGREKLVRLGKLSGNFLERPETIDYYVYAEFSINLHSIQTFRSMFSIFQSGNKLLNNWLDCVYEKYKPLGPSYRPPRGPVLI